MYVKPIILCSTNSVILKSIFVKLNKQARAVRQRESKGGNDKLEQQSESNCFDGRVTLYVLN